MNLYIPPGCKSLAEELDIPQIRLGIQGYGNTGKTWSALTFPNPIVLNLDRGLGAHIGRADVHELKFYDPIWVKEFVDPNFKKEDLKYAIITWLSKQGPKLMPNQTLIVDGNTSLQNAYHSWFEFNKMKFLTDKGVIDGFAEYKLKKQYYGEVMELLKSLPCHVVFICHETEASIGKLSGKLRPLLTGQFADELSIHFTDFFRQQSSTIPENFNEAGLDKLAKLSNWKMTRQEFEAWCKSFPRRTMYFWQPDGDSNFDGKCSSLVNYPAYMPASYESFTKYRRNKSS